MPDMKTLTINGVTYVIADDKARAVVTPDNLYVDPDTNMLYLMSDGQIVGDGVIVATGSGGSGGGGNAAVVTLKNASGWTYKTVSTNSPCKIYITWSSLEEGLETGDGTISVKIGGVSRYTSAVKQGEVELDVTDYLTTGDNNIRITVTDVYGNSRTLAVTVNVIAVSIESSFDPLIPYEGEISFPFTPVGSIEKVVHFFIDGVEVASMITSFTGRQQTQPLPAQKHGSHTIRVYFDATIDGETIKSNELYYDIACLESGKTDAIITSDFKEENIEQYVTTPIRYRVYDPGYITTKVDLYEKTKMLSSLVVDRTIQTWSYRPDTVGEMSLSIKATGSNGKVITKEIVFNVSESRINAEATTDDLSLFLSAYGRSNNEMNPGSWVYGSVEAEFKNFNFKTDCWQIDEDGATVMRLLGDARLDIPYYLFETDSRTSGKTIEIEFATRDVFNYDTTILSCMFEGRGIQMTAQKATLSSEQSTIGTQYKEEEHVRLSFVIEKRSGTKLLLCYINGILSGSVRYPDDDDFSQRIPTKITIGSNECTTDIYNIRVYDNNLTRYQILDNWIADTQVGSLRLERYERNQIYDGYGNITTATMKKDLPYLVIVAPSLPQFKGDKKTCSGHYIDPVDPTKSFSFENAQIDVQGTSSQYYYVKNYKIKFKGGFILWDGTSAKVYQLHEDSIPVSTYTFKADVASSEGANNVVLAQIYNDLCPVKTPPQEKDPRIRTTIDGHPIVIFWDNGAQTKFIGKYNFNMDKGTEEVYGFTEGDESWEIRQNGTERTGFRSADFSGTDWQNDFEARYPEDNLDPSNLAAFAAWVVSTNADAATGRALTMAAVYDGVRYTNDTAEYRLAKFKAELPDYGDVSALVFYYVITELFLCIDQREKNAFPTYFAENPYWLMFFYDADSSLGINNKGELAFDYYLEDIDYTEAGDPVFNGQASVLWVNLRKCFYDQIMAEYKRLRTTMRTDGSGLPLISYEVVDKLFEAHQGKWGEAIYNEDGFRKSIEPYISAGDAAYLPMLQGKKEQQRKWWTYNRFRYMDSKYVTGSSMEVRIIIRAHSQANIKLIAYTNMYGHVYYNSEMVEHRMVRGQEYEFVWTASGAEDAVIGINDADMLTSIGDLSQLMVETIDISKATHLTSLKVGDGDEGYRNINLTNITLGNNTLLKSIDLRNCSSLTQAVDATGCTGVEEIYLEGSSITSISVPNGGILKTLHLPGTITNLTLRNQKALTDFVLPDYSKISTLRLENNSSVIDTLGILNAIAEGSRVRVIGFDMIVNDASEIQTLFNRLDTMRGLDENGNNTDTAQVSGTIHVDTIRGTLVEDLKKRYPSITIDYKHITALLTYRNYDETLLYTEEIKDGQNGNYGGEVPKRPTTETAMYAFAGWSRNNDNVLDETATKNVTSDRVVYAVYAVTPIYYVRYYSYDGSTLYYTDKLIGAGHTSTFTQDNPKRTPTTQYFFSFSGWSRSIDGDAEEDAQKMVLSDRNLYAAYTKTLRSYTITWKNASVTLEVDANVPYGEMPEYNGATPVYTLEDPTDWEFIGWTPEVKPVTGAVTYTAKFRYTGYFYTKIVDRSINGTYENARVTGLKSRAFQDASRIEAVSFPNVTSIGDYAFYDASNLASVNMPELLEMGYCAFFRTALATVDFPKVKNANSSAFQYAYNLVTVGLRGATTIADSAFAYASSLAEVDIPSVTKIEMYAFRDTPLLKKLTLNSITDLSEQEIFSNSGLESLIIRNENEVPTLGNTTFQGSLIESGSGYIYVPRKLIESYKSATNWSNYGDQIRAVEDYDAGIYS